MTFYFLTYEFDPVVRDDMGGHRKVVEVAEALGAAGHRAVVFTPRLGRPWRTSRALVVQFRVPPWNVARPLAAYLGLVLLPLLRRRETPPDVLYSRQLHVPVLPLLARLLGVPLIVESSGDVLAYHAARGTAWWRRAWITFAERVNFGRADGIVALTRGMGEAVHRRAGVPWSRIRIVPSGTNLDLFAPGDRGAALARLGWPAMARVVGFVGMFLPHQGVGTLLDAVAALAPRIPELRALLVGDGEMRAAWEAQAASLALGERVRFTGQVPFAEVPRYVAAMDVAVAPFRAGRGETSPLKLFDYWACGRPAVVADIPPVHEVAEASGAAILVPPDNPERLAAALADLLADPERRRVMGERGRRFVEAESGWSRAAARIAEFAAELTARRAAAPKASRPHAT